MKAPRSAYIHIPFCRRRCFYCDFAVSVVGDRKRGDSSPTIARYIDTLLTEINATPKLGSPPAPLETVFFGGGTPSLLTATQVEAIISAIDRRFGISPSAEISMEMDPATFELAHIQGYKAAGINRVSLGVQAFQDELLAAAGRFHRQADIFHAVDLIHQANIPNFSIDLISGLPHQTLADWQASLDQAIALNPAHISIYDLLIEPQTPFSRYFTPGEAPLPSQAITAEMYTLAQHQLTAHGYDHYEICNYAKPGYAAQHNLTYWRCEANYGFGMGATSYLPQPGGPQRIDRPRTQKTYQSWVEQFVTRGGETDDSLLPPTEQVVETIMMGLRLKPGISLETVYDVYGQVGLEKLGRAIAPHIQSGWVIVQSESTDTTHNNPTDAATPDSANVTNLKPTDRIHLSDPEGFLMSNIVIVDAFNALEALSAN
ncbi:MAG: radical SAM family heme chaperone HemW [Cyanobacteria bacterium J06606_4]